MPKGRWYNSSGNTGPRGGLQLRNGPVAATFMGLHLFTRLGPLKGLVFRLWLADARAKERQFLEFLRPDDRILDLGSGPGSVCQCLRARGFAVTPVDVEDVALDRAQRPQLYDGRRLPFAAGAFDVALVLTVLHHTRDPALVLAEACRVARRVVVIEDVFANAAQKYLTWWADSVLNLEFRGHPHTNRTDAGWRRLFAARSWRLERARRRCVAGIFQQQTYLLDPGPALRPAARAPLLPTLAGAG